MKPISELWHSKDANDWQGALERYWEFVRPENVFIERAMQCLSIERVHGFSDTEWFEFLRDEYIKWKYTDCRWRQRSTKSLNTYLETNSLAELDRLRRRLIFFTAHHDYCGALKAADEIRGLGISGASGLLAIIYPQIYATVDRFVVESLTEVQDLPEASRIAKMRSTALTLKDAMLLIEVMRRQAVVLNKVLDTCTWTPRKIDMVLWATRQKR